MMVHLSCLWCMIAPLRRVWRQSRRHLATIEQINAWNLHQSEGTESFFEIHAQSVTQSILTIKFVDSHGESVSVIALTVELSHHNTPAILFVKTCLCWTTNTARKSMLVHRFQMLALMNWTCRHSRTLSVATFGFPRNSREWPSLVSDDQHGWQIMMDLFVNSSLSAERQRDDKTIDDVQRSGAKRNVWKDITIMKNSLGHNWNDSTRIFSTILFQVRTHVIAGASNPIQNGTSRRRDSKSLSTSETLRPDACSHIAQLPIISSFPKSPSNVKHPKSTPDPLTMQSQPGMFQTAPRAQVTEETNHHTDIGSLHDTTKHATYQELQTHEMRENGRKKKENNRGTDGKNGWKRKIVRGAVGKKEKVNKHQKWMKKRGEEKNTRWEWENRWGRQKQLGKKQKIGEKKD